MENNEPCHYVGDERGCRAGMKSAAANSTEAPADFDESFRVYQKLRRQRLRKRRHRAAGVRHPRGDGPAAWQVLFEVARGLGQPFGLSALVLAAWAASPALFGLAGAGNAYPCSHRVRCLLYGPRGLLGRGLVRKAGDGLFEVVRGEETGGSNAS